MGGARTASVSVATGLGNNTDPSLSLAHRFDPALNKPKTRTHNDTCSCFSGSCTLSLVSQLKIRSLSTSNNQKVVSLLQW